MGKKTKIGKQRKDKYYQLAKDTGYRSRAAFKLIQLNRKFEFLQKSRVCIDLCAAPGGWMQVAKQNMPVSSIVIGVDLFPIKPIPGCISITEDITSEKCKSQLQKELKTWKADIVLNDGAPNIGKNWLHDAYQQSCLTLSALKVATEFLRQGGWFITKIFRSKDYQPLIWVLKQLFKKVYSTKPQASRSESAEIFVVCQYYIAPHKLDNRFLDPKFVFEELDVGTDAQKLNIFHPEKTKTRALGYPEGVTTLHNSVSATELIFGKQGPLEVLQYVTEVVIDDDRILNDSLTTAEIKECCKDIKVLGRKDLRRLLNWCKTIKESFKKEKEETKVENAEEIEMENEGDPEIKDLEEEEKEIEVISKQIKDLQEEERKEAKRKRKQMLKEQRKLREKMDLKMVLRGDEGPQLNENIDVKDSVFDLKLLKKSKDLEAVTDDAPDILAREDVDKKCKKRMVRFKDDDDDSISLDESSGSGSNERGVATEETDDYSQNEKERNGISSEDEASVDASEEEESSEDEENKMTERPIGERKSALITDLDERDKSQKRKQKVELWFQKDAFRGLEDSEFEDYELNRFMTKTDTKNGKFLNGISKDKTNGKGINSDSDNDDSSDDDVTEEEDDKHLDTCMNTKKVEKVAVKDGFEIVPANKDKVKKRKLDPEALALGTLMATSKKSKRDIMDMSWNRYAFNDREGLPDWFVEDEKKHMKKNIPLPKDMVEDLKAREREMNVRPIKKVIEAKARKKKRAIRKLEKARKRVESLMDNPELSEREKSKQIKQLYKKATGTKKKEVKYVVAKKHTMGKRGGRPAGLKGLYKVVDPRMKKDNRKLKTMKSKGKGTGRGRKPLQRKKSQKS